MALNDRRPWVRDVRVDGGYRDRGADRGGGEGIIGADGEAAGVVQLSSHNHPGAPESPWQLMADTRHRRAMPWSEGKQPTLRE